MISIKNKQEIEKMRVAGKVAYDLLMELKDVIKPGITTKEIDNFCYDFIVSRGCTPAFLDYEGFPASACVSINDMVVHGIPDFKTVLKEGDVISIDLVVEYKGYNGDAARTFPVGKISPEKQKLIDVTRECFFKGIENLKIGHRLGELSHAIQTHAESNGFSVVRELVGHGIGKSMHEPPNIPNYGKVTDGPLVTDNAVLAVEPMINMGRKEVWRVEDGWGVVTRDGMPSAHYENTVHVTKDGIEIWTL